jgi:hypothetical protein
MGPFVSEIAHDPIRLGAMLKLFFRSDFNGRHNEAVLAERACPPALFASAE